MRIYFPGPVETVFLTLFFRKVQRISFIQFLTLNLLLFGNLQEYENLHFLSTFADPDSIRIRIRSGQFLAHKLFHCNWFWALPVWLALQGIGFCLYFCNFKFDPDSIRIRAGHFLAQKPFHCHRSWALPVGWLCAVLDFACTFAILSLIRIRSGFDLVSFLPHFFSL